MDLDDLRGFRAVDPHDALGDIEATARQWREARASAGPALDLDAVGAVLLTGMGGSGIAGDLVGALAADHLDIPVLVHKDHGLPRWVDSRALVVGLSYSGETAETLSAVSEAITRGCLVLTISSGGALDTLAAEQGLGRVTVPGGGMPRHNLGKLAVPALVALGLEDGLDEAVTLQSELVAGCGRRVPVSSNPAKQLATSLARGGQLVACASSGLPAVAAGRLKCMLSENAKLTAFTASVPEFCHNEIAGWERKTSVTRATGIVWLRDPAAEDPALTRRITLTDELLATSAAWTTHVIARGHTPLARVASLLLFVDLVSVYTAIAFDRDPTPITTIDKLKQDLAGQRV